MLFSPCKLSKDSLQLLVDCFILLFTLLMLYFTGKRNFIELLLVIWFTQPFFKPCCFHQVVRTWRWTWTRTQTSRWCHRDPEPCQEAMVRCYIKRSGQLEPKTWFVLNTSWVWSFLCKTMTIDQQNPYYLLAQTCFDRIIMDNNLYFCKALIKPLKWSFLSFKHLVITFSALQNNFELYLTIT